jgi:hypothetical protein
MERHETRSEIRKGRKTKWSKKETNQDRRKEN